MRRIALGLLCLSLAACAAGRKSAVGFRLPDGDAARGQAAFVELKCYACHSVAGVTLPDPIVDPAVRVIELGGLVPQPPTDGDLTASIVHPSHRIASGYGRTYVQSGGLSRMGDFGGTMTVHQLVDLVAFLQSTYEVEIPAVSGP